MEETSIDFNNAIREFLDDQFVLRQCMRMENRVKPGSDLLYRGVDQNLIIFLFFFPLCEVKSGAKSILRLTTCYFDTMTRTKNIEIPF